MGVVDPDGVGWGRGPINIGCLDGGYFFNKGKGIWFIVLYQPKCSHDLPPLAGLYTRKPFQSPGGYSRATGSIHNTDGPISTIGCEKSNLNRNVELPKRLF